MSLSLRILYRMNYLKALSMALLLATASLSPAQSTTAGSISPYRIAGTVVNTISGEPVPRASVTLYSTHGEVPIVTRLSANDGSFLFDALPEDRYELRVSKRGFLSSLYEQHENFTRSIVTGPGQETETILFHLMPTASLQISVQDDTGDPVEAAQVHLFRKEQEEGLGSMLSKVQDNFLRTDDQGNLRVDSLEPGDYYIAVSATPWYQLTSQTPQYKNPALDSVYPTTFYNGVTDQNAATAFQLLPGRHETLQITLQALPALHLTLPMAKGSVPSPQLQQLIFGFWHPANINTNRSENFLEFTSVAPGQYVLQAYDPPRQIEFNAASNQQIATDSGAGTTTLHCHFFQGRVAAAPENASLHLVRVDAERLIPWLGGEMSSAEMTISNVATGTWEILLYDKNNYPIPIQSIESHGKILPGNRLQVTEKTSELKIQLGASEGHIRGFAKIGSKSRAGVMVVLVPRDPELHGDRFRRDQTDSDGSFNLLQVAPGEYTIVAIEDGWDLPWQRPEILARFLSHGVSVHLSEDLKKPLALTTPVPVQSHAGELLSLPAETSPQMPHGTSSKPGGEDSL